MQRICLFALLLGLMVTGCGSPGDRYYEPTRRAASGAAVGAGVGALFDGSRGAMAGAVVGGLLGVASTPTPQRSYRPRSVSSGQMQYAHY